MKERRRAAGGGAITLQVMVILVPVVFGLMGFAVDLGRLYMVRGELKAAANAMALAAAQQLIGTDVSLDLATASARLALSSSGGLQNKYDFGGLPIGETTGQLASEAPDPTYYETVTAAFGEGEGGGSEASGGTTARHVRVRITAEAPLLFWGFLPQASERKAPIAVAAVAGRSAPLCTACGIEVVAVAAPDASDETDFGFVANTRYTLGYVCNGAPQPGPLQPAAARIPYLVINRFNTDAQIFAGEATQALRIGAQGLPASTSAARACVSVNAAETIWESAVAIGCNQNSVPAVVTGMLCGLATRFESDLQTNCLTIAESETLASIYTPDTDTTDVEDYAAYTGNGRRVLTVAIVDSLANPQAMTVLGFRQFLLEPNLNSTTTSTLDANGRFNALYIGSVVPLKQGRFDGCTIASGPGKVVLHQ